ncbi:acyl-CoA dehydrogenase [Amycolatopsis sp. AA4]|uniref:acyl-CoA dehydrogenase family protein n=1 Tax=Actinomycetes TaxID=1760 RepID=UPI0001B5807B|nr:MULTISPECIES: acyl-CoA dehydrogenase family protein [Actinomycetes]ATY12375.1 acyl-CoA dehydrogenase [Amycolatopsis sp. AA4]
MDHGTALGERIRGFVDTKIVPAEDLLDRGDPARLRDLRAEARQAGLWALPLPGAHGGAGLALADYFAVAEQEGRSDHGPDVLGSSALLNFRMLAAHADPGRRVEWLPALVAGDLTVSYAMTEPGVPGSEPAAMRTRAERAGGGWRITGRKWFTTGAARAGLVLVMARTGDGFSLFAVPAGGFRVVRELDVLGAGGQYELAIEGTLVPDANVVGEIGNGLALAGERLALGRTLRALRWVGQAQRAVELLARRAATRELAGAVLGDRQLVQRLLFEAELLTRATRSLTADAASPVAAGERAQVPVSLAKVAAARALETAVDGAIQVYGAEGLTSATGLPRLLRTARAARILDGADELHITSAARRLMRSYQGR